VSAGVKQEISGIAKPGHALLSENIALTKEKVAGIRKHPAVAGLLEVAEGCAWISRLPPVRMVKSDG